MSYVERNLMPGEELLLRPHYHWVRFVPGGGLVLLAIVGLVVWFVRRGQEYEVYLIWGVAGFFVLGLLAMGWRWLVDSFDEFAITSTRVIRKQGFLSRNVRQIPLDRVQDLNLRATLWGRWLAYGDVELQTAGADGTVVFPRIQHPEEFRNVLFVHRAPVAGGGLGAAVAAAPPARSTVEERLRELDRLKAQGLITDEELKERRKAILESV